MAGVWLSPDSILLESMGNMLQNGSSCSIRHVAACKQPNDDDMDVACADAGMLKAAGVQHICGYTTCSLPPVDWFLPPSSKQSDRSTPDLELPSNH